MSPPPPMPTISPHELQDRLRAEPGLVLIDVRTPVEFAEVHIPGARSIPLDRLDPTSLRSDVHNDPSVPIYLVCRSGERATRARAQLVAAGWREPTVVTGGTEGWLEAGLPVERSAVRTISLERQVRIAAGLLVVTGVVLGTWVHPAGYGLSGFVGIGLVFAGITNFCGMGLLLARLPWNQRVSNRS